MQSCFVQEKPEYLVNLFKSFFAIHFTPFPAHIHVGLWTHIKYSLFVVFAKANDIYFYFSFFRKVKPRMFSFVSIREISQLFSAACSAYLLTRALFTCDALDATALTMLGYEKRLRRDGMTRCKSSFVFAWWGFVDGILPSLKIFAKRLARVFMKWLRVLLNMAYVNATTSISALSQSTHGWLRS